MQVQRAVCPFGGTGTLDFEEPQKAPSREPPMLPLVPGEVEQARRVSFEKPRKKKLARTRKWSKDPLRPLSIAISCHHPLVYDVMMIYAQ